MKQTSSRIKALTVSIAFTLWFYIGTSIFDVFSFPILIIFAIGIFTIFQILASKISDFLNIFAIFNTKIFLGVLFVFVISLYGICFKILKIDLLRLKNNNDTYWLEMKDINEERIFKQY
jgi:hypothetical protein